ALVADALDLAGYGEVTRRFFFLCGELITREGYLLHKYNPDGSLGSSWHAWSTPDGRLELPIQEDETGLPIWALWQPDDRDGAIVRPVGRAPWHPCLHDCGCLGGSHRRAELRGRVRTARACEALRGRGAGNTRSGPGASVGRRPGAVRAHHQRDARRDDREGRDHRHLARGYLSLWAASRGRRAHPLDDARRRGPFVGQDAGGWDRAVRERLLLPGLVGHRRRPGQSLVHRHALARRAPDRDRRDTGRPGPAARLPRLVRPPRPAIGGPFRTGPSLHRRAALGLAAHLVARRIRQRGAALRPPLSPDQ